jgi:Protein of unknown function (DUF3014)
MAKLYVTPDPGDIDLVRSGTDDPLSMPPRGRAAAILTVAAVLLLAVVGGYLYVRRASAPASTEQARPAASAPAQLQRTEQMALPPLDQSDALVRELVARLSSHPTVAAWLTTDGLIMNFVVVTTKIAEGQTPSGELKAVGPVGAFLIRKSQTSVHIDPASYRRYDRYAEAVAAIDARGAARLYETLKPRVIEAHRRFGTAEGEADRTLERAIVELLRVPVVEGDIALEPQGIGYAFADPRLEQLSAAQKQLLRMGPDNVRKIQAKLREIAPHLGIVESRLPGSSGTSS